MVVIPVPSDDIDRHWNLMRGFLDDAIATSGGRWEPEDVLAEARRGTMQLWAILEGTMLYGVGVTQIRQYPRLKSVDCLWLGGVDAHLWLEELNNVVGKWAAEQGCSRLEMIARKGWERMGKPLGFVPRFVVFEREVTNGPG